MQLQLEFFGKDIHSTLGDSVYSRRWECSHQVMMRNIPNRYTCGEPQKSLFGRGVYQSTGRMIAEYCMIYDRI
jgi:hypothetical protein